MSNIKQDAAWIRVALGQFENRISQTSGPVSDRDALKELVRDFCARVQSMTDDLGGDGSYIATDVANFNDALDNAFVDAIDAEELESDEFEHSLSIGDAARDERKHAGVL